MKHSTSVNNSVNEVYLKCNCRLCQYTKITA